VTPRRASASDLGGAGQPGPGRGRIQVGAPGSLLRLLTPRRSRIRGRSCRSKWFVTVAGVTRYPSQRSGHEGRDHQGPRVTTWLLPEGSASPSPWQAHGCKEQARPEREPWPEPPRGGPTATEQTPLPEPRRPANWSGPAAGSGQAIGPEEGPRQTREIRWGCRRSARTERANPSEPGWARRRYADWPDGPGPQRE
jgi:hypothetical protein